MVVARFDTLKSSMVWTSIFNSKLGSPDGWFLFWTFNLTDLQIDNVNVKYNNRLDH